MTQFGFSGLNKRINTSSNKINLPSPSLIIVGRVSDIILDESHPNFGKEGTLGEGGWASLGNISFIDIKMNGPSNGAAQVARPLSPSINNPPVKDELVYILSLPNKSSQTDSSSTSFYYLNVINIWNHPLHNINPFFKDIQSSPGQNKSYSSTLISSNPGVSSSTPSTVNSNSSWIENLHTKPLYAYLGDYIIEGRFNNSIRIGSTSKKSTNNWSSSGNEGDPIIILRNNYLSKTTTDDFIPVSEDINTDSSSIYLTSTQKIPIRFPNERYTAYKTPPKSLNSYNEPQIILTSDRLTLFSKKDHILLNSVKSIGMNSIEGVNITSNGDFIVDSKNILLGNVGATEPVLLGNKTVYLLESLLASLDYLCISLQGSLDWPKGEAAPASSIRAAASSTQSIIKDLQKTLPSIKSQITKTI